MAKSGITWTVPPEKLQTEVEKYGELTKTRVGQMAFDESKDAEAYMRQNRPWNDISGNARRGLRTDVEVEVGGKKYTIYFIHSANYGKYLELARGGRYAIIMPTIERTGPIIRRRLAGLAN